MTGRGQREGGGDEGHGKWQGKGCADGSVAFVGGVLSRDSEVDLTGDVYQYWLL